MMMGEGNIKNKLKCIFELLRPFTLLAPLIVSSSIMIASYIYSGRNDLSSLPLILMIIPASFCLALLNGASNTLNQATDYKEDSYSKPYRPIPKGIISKKDAYKLSFILYVLAISISLFVNITFSFFTLMIAFFSITYSLPPRMKKYLFINQLWVAIPRGFLAILCSWSVFDNPLQNLPLSIGIISAIFLFGGTTTKDVLDAEADTSVGTKTLLNQLGIKKSALISFIFMGGAFILIIPLVFFGFIETYLLPLSILFIFSFMIFWQMLYSKKNERCENTSAWTLMYATYFIFALSFAIITISFS